MAPIRRILTVSVCLCVLNFHIFAAEERCDGNCQNGRGVYHYASGGRYEGEFRGGQADGQGIYYLPAGTVLYRGDWKKGQPEGSGEYFLEGGKRYVGQLVAGQFHGNGTYFFPSGARYEGEFRNGYFEGRGVFVRADGTRQVGLFERDHLIREIADSQPSGSAERTQVVPADTIQEGAARPDRYLHVLRDRRVAVIANQSSLSNNEHLVTILQRAKVNLRRILTPEHGLNGTAGPGEPVGNSWSRRFRLPVISLYQHSKRIPHRSVRDVDIIVYDIQDVGVRFYTYISTLHYAMEACARYDIPLLVLDRPNPNGFYVDGPVLHPRYRSFVGMDPVPLVYGMTAGEYARMINGEGWLNGGRQCRLTVVPNLNYSHAKRYTLPVRPSPNLPDMQSIYLYPHIGLFEATALSVGRGTPYPFKVVGHPDLPGNFQFVPRPGPGAGDGLKLPGRICRGFDLRGEPVTERPGLQLRWLIEAYRSFPDRDHFFDSGRFIRMAGGPELLQQIRDGWSENQIRASWRPSLDRFLAIRQKYLLYD